MNMKNLLHRIRVWLIEEIDENHPNALSMLDARDGVGSGR